jgi:hypothetical protein
MQLIKIVFAVLAVGGTGYALFRLSSDAPGWVKALGLVMGIATLVGVVIALPQALDALEHSVDRVGRWLAPSAEELRRREQEDARRATEEAARRAVADEAARREREETQRREAREAEARRKADEAAQKKTEEEATRAREADARRRAAQEAEDARRRAAEEAERERIRDREREAARREAQRREAERAATEERRRLTEIVRADRCKAVSVCPPGKIFSIPHGECIHLQYYGGIIPGSQDDAGFDQRTGRWVPNCR